MCGISGVLLRGESQSQLERYRVANEQMVVLQKARGPDADGTLVLDSMCLGHSRLAIMDPENPEGNQPVESTKYALVFNGEIYNFRALRSELESSGRVFATQCDTEVLLQALDHWGVEATLPKLNGIFAFAAYDKASRSLHLVRDRLGVKPLNYHVDSSGAVWFASAPAAIVRASGAKWSLDYEGLYRFFRLGAPWGEPTLFCGLRRVLPGEHLRFGASGGMQRSSYWRPRVVEKDVVEAVYEAAARQKEAHVRSALFLSGGVDSSILSSALRDIDFFHLDSPERSYAEYVASFVNRKLLVKNYESSLEFEKFNREYARSCGEPSASAPIPYLISLAMKEEGFKVAFSANGADELFFGYPRTPAPELDRSNFPAGSYEDPSYIGNQEQLDHIFRRHDSFSIPKANGNLHDMRSDRWIWDEVSKLDSAFPPSAQSRWFELQTYVAFDLNQTLDFASMACSLEVRVPFLDHELVEVALSKNANEMVSADYGRKAPLKRALKAQGLHPCLWSRPKLGFSVSPEVVERRRRSLSLAVGELEREGFLELDPRCAAGSRDDQYLSSAAQAFLMWKAEWIDSGTVAA